MALNVSNYRKTAIGGRTYTTENTVDAELAVEFDKNLGAAKTGSLTTRTDNDTGTLTMDPGHGITTGARLDVYWSGGRRYGMTVGTVATNSVPIDGGAGDNLPAAAAAITAMVPAEEAVAVTGNNVAAVGIKTTTVQDAVVVIADGSNALLASAVVTAGEDYVWTDQDGTTNPLAGDTVAKVFVSHGDSSGTKNVRGILAYN
jgi:hypothetical protein